MRILAIVCYLFLARISAFQLPSGINIISTIDDNVIQNAVGEYTRFSDSSSHAYRLKTTSTKKSKFLYQSVNGVWSITSSEANIKKNKGTIVSLFPEESPFSASWKYYSGGQWIIAQNHEFTILESLDAIEHDAVIVNSDSDFSVRPTSTNAQQKAKEEIDKPDKPHDEKEQENSSNPSMANLDLSQNNLKNVETHTFLDISLMYSRNRNVWIMVWIIIVLGFLFSPQFQHFRHINSSPSKSLKHKTNNDVDEDLIYEYPLNSRVDVFCIKDHSWKSGFVQHKHIDKLSGSIYDVEYDDSSIDQNLHPGLIRRQKNRCFL